MKNRIRETLPDAIDDRPRALIKIAHLPDETNCAPRINAGEARSIILASRLIAYLAFLLWKLEWDRFFWIVDGDVFIRLIDTDLFVDSEAVEGDLHQFLEQFCEWREATLINNLSTTADPEALRAARDVIDKTAKAITPSGQSLADVFSDWVTRFSRVSAFRFSLPLGVSGARIIHMPPSSRMLPSLQPLGANSAVAEVPSAKIVAKTEAICLRSADGSEYLCVRDGIGAESMSGRLVHFHRHPGPSVKSWIRARKMS